MSDQYGQAFHPSAGRVIAKVDNEGKITLLVPESEWDAIMERLVNTKIAVEFQKVKPTEYLA